MEISDVRLKGNYLQVFNSEGKKISELNSSHGELCGIASDFYVVEHGNYYRTYDTNSKKIAEINTSHGDFRNAAGRGGNTNRSGERGPTARGIPRGHHRKPTTESLCGWLFGELARK